MINIKKNILIAHRGNLEGPIPEKENHPDYLLKSVALGYAVETDIWRLNGGWVLGHDLPQYEIGEDVLAMLGNAGFLWSHIKNIEALQELASDSKYECWNYFWHQKDDYALVSGGYIWSYPNKELTKQAICVLPELAEYDLPDILSCKGICTDYVIRYEKLLGTT